MNTQQAKRIPLRDILGRLGHEPVKEVRGDLWYRSPFRHETDPSFKINIDRNIWYDFGEGEGGNVLDFVMKYHQVSTIAAALDELRSFDQPRLPTLSPPRPDLPPGPAPTQTPLPEMTVKPLQHKALTTYLAGRGVPADLAARYLDEVHYTRDGKAYFALGFRNDSGGYELRNPYFKGTHGPKDLTVLEGLASVEPRVAVFEGFMDFLSAQVTGTLAQPLPAVIVMNSAALKERTVAAIRQRGALSVDLYLDRDPAGRDITAFIQQELPGITVADRSDIYARHKDFNEYLVSQHRQATGR